METITVVIPPFWEVRKNANEEKVLICLGDLYLQCSRVSRVIYAAVLPFSALFGCITLVWMHRILKSEFWWAEEDSIWKNQTQNWNQLERQSDEDHHRGPGKGELVNLSDRYADGQGPGRKPAPFFSPSERGERNNHPKDGKTRTRNTVI